MEKKDQTIGFKVSATMKEKTVWVERRTSIAFTDILRLATELVIAHVEQHGQITMPFALIPEQELTALRQRADARENPPPAVKAKAKRKA